MSEEIKNEEIKEEVPAEEAKPARSEQEVKDHVAKIINHIRPYILGDGGDVELVSVEDGIVTISLLGACVGCSMLDVTLNSGIRNWILEEVPEVKDVVLTQPEMPATDFSKFYEY